MDIVKQIGYAMSLRAPQREALEALHNSITLIKKINSFFIKYLTMLHFVITIYLPF
ncbi:MAG: hypothetical protein LBF68_06135 [Christensenellaceae bacterium]|jgi:hypothetical protein|nr:hypothetical protein [Christensenellaceae bacterium]